MALTTPILYSVNAFDAQNSFIFQFASIGGNQAVANTLTIKNNATLSTVYSATQTTFKFEHILPANTLTNGTYYQATLTTKDAQGNESSPSNPIQFYCYSKPTFVISNMPTGNVVTNSSFAFNVTYNQIQGEILNAYVFNLYSASGVLISTSGTMYNTDSTLPLTLSYLFSGFEDKANYSVEVTGVTTNGTQITTGRVGFTTSYTTPDTFSFLFLTNNCKGGYITIESNIIGIDGETNPDPATYIDNKEIDVRADGNYVQWVKGYEINGNWTMRLWGRNFRPNQEIFRFSNVNGDIITITYRNNGETENVRRKVNYTVTNLIGEAGNFETGTYSATSSELAFLRTSSRHKYGEKCVAFLGTTDAVEKSYIIKDSGGTITPHLNPTHKYYASVWIYQTTLAGSMDLYWPEAEPPIFSHVPVNASETWQQVSTVFTRSTFDEGNYPVRLDFNNENSTVYMWFDGLMLVDLTETFGANNEPDKKWCDENIAFTPNTITVSWWETPADIPTIVEKSWLEMRAVHANNVWGYTIESEHIGIPETTEQVCCWLRRVDNLYELKIENRGVES